MTAVLSSLPTSFSRPKTLPSSVMRVVSPTEDMTVTSPSEDQPLSAYEASQLANAMRMAASPFTSDDGFLQERPRERLEDNNTTEQSATPLTASSRARRQRPRIGNAGLRLLTSPGQTGHAAPANSLLASKDGHRSSSAPPPLDRQSQKTSATATPITKSQTPNIEGPKMTQGHVRSKACPANCKDCLKGSEGAQEALASRQRSAPQPAIQRSRPKVDEGATGKAVREPTAVSTLDTIGPLYIPKHRSNAQIEQGLVSDESSSNLSSRAKPNPVDLNGRLNISTDVPTRSPSCHKCGKVRKTEEPLMPIDRGTAPATDPKQFAQTIPEPESIVRVG